MPSARTGCERLHPLDGDPLGELGAHLGELGVAPGQDRRALAHGWGQQQLTARRRPEPVPGDLERALVGDAEVADLLDVVAPELHPQGVLLGGREHVEDPAADGELAALLDQVGRGVADGHQGRGELLVGDLVARAHHDGLQVAQALDDRLQQRPDRGDHEVERRRSSRRRGPGAPAGAGPPAADRPCPSSGSGARAGGSPTPGARPRGRARSGCSRPPRGPRPAGWWR